MKKREKRNSQRRRCSLLGMEWIIYNGELGQRKERIQVVWTYMENKERKREKNSWGGRRFGGEGAGFVCGVGYLQMVWRERGKK